MFIKHVEAPKVSQNDERTGEEVVRIWAAHIGSVRAAEREAGIYPRHMHTWFDDPDRCFNPTTALKVATAAGIPVEAVLYKDVPIKDLTMWKFMNKRKKAKK